MGPKWTESGIRGIYKRGAQAPCDFFAEVRMSVLLLINFFHAVSSKVYDLPSIALMGSKAAEACISDSRCAAAFK